jgi:hypothetical protein
MTTLGCPLVAEPVSYAEAFRLLCSVLILPPKIAIETAGQLATGKPDRSCGFLMHFVGKIARYDCQKLSERMAHVAKKSL